MRWADAGGGRPARDGRMHAWVAGKKLLQDIDLLNKSQVASLHASPARLSPRLAQMLHRFTDSEDFQPDQIVRASQLCALFCEWIHAVAELVSAPEYAAEYSGRLAAHALQDSIEREEELQAVHAQTTARFASLPFWALRSDSGGIVWAEWQCVHHVRDVAEYLTCN